MTSPGWLIPWEVCAKEKQRPLICFLGSEGVKPTDTQHRKEDAIPKRRFTALTEI